ncbi:phosphotransferase enzyme family protein [Salinifilum ghardaiensis]
MISKTRLGSDGRSVSAGGGGSASPARPVTRNRRSRARLSIALAQVCAQAGLDPRGARLLRFVNNAVFRLRRHDVVVRIVLAPSLSHRARAVVVAARWLAENDVPAVRLLPDVPQPVVAGGYVATLWRAVPDAGEPSAEHLGSLLRELHTVAPAPELPEWDPIADVRRKVADAEELSAEDRAFLLHRCESLRNRLSAQRARLTRAAVHGDAHLGNVILGPRGPVLCDLDSMCAGPPEWDMTPLAVGHLRMGHPPERYRRFAATYGTDVTGRPEFPLLRALRELKITASALPVLRSNPRIAEQLRHRLRTMRAGDLDTAWAPYRSC